MFDHWFRHLRCKMSWEDFHKLPRHPAYRYEYLSGELWLSARPKYRTCKLDLTNDNFDRADVEGVTLRPLREEDWEPLKELFAHAFRQTVPFDVLSGEECLEAGRSLLGATADGKDGLLIDFACHVAEEESREIVGASIVTMVQGEHLFPLGVGRPSEQTGEPDAQDRFPHLSWIFVSPQSSRLGIGQQLLSHSAASVAQLGHPSLYSTFLLGQWVSMLWHWKAGFELLPDPFPPLRSS